MAQKKGIIDYHSFARGDRLRRVRAAVTKVRIRRLNEYLDTQRRAALPVWFTTTRLFRTVSRVRISKIRGGGHGE